MEKKEKILKREKLILKKDKNKENRMWRGMILQVEGPGKAISAGGTWAEMWMEKGSQP